MQSAHKKVLDKSSVLWYNGIVARDEQSDRPRATHKKIAKALRTLDFHLSVSLFIRQALAILERSLTLGFILSVSLFISYPFLTFCIYYSIFCFICQHFFLFFYRFSNKPDPYFSSSERLSDYALYLFLLLRAWCLLCG